MEKIDKSYKGIFFNVTNKNLVNKIREDGSLLSPDLWFRHMENFHDDELCVVMHDYDKFNMIDREGNLLFDKDKSLYSIRSNFGGYYVAEKEMYHFIILNKKGNIVLDLGDKYYDVSNYTGGFFIVHEEEDKSNFLDIHGNLLLHDDTLECYDAFCNGYGVVKKLFDGEYKHNIISKNGDIISPDKWFDMVGYVNSGYFPVTYGDRYNLIDIHGKLIDKDGFDFCEGFSSTSKLAVVSRDKKFNFIDVNGHFISKEWFDDCQNNYDNLDLTRPSSSHDKNYDK